MSRILTRVILAGVAALAIATGSLTLVPVVATAASEPPSDVSVPPAPAAWQQQWDLLLRQEDQLRRDEQQVQEIAPRLRPNLVDQLQQGQELTRQRLAQRRQQLLRQQPQPDPAAEVTHERAAGSSMAPSPAVVVWPGS